MFSYMKIKNSIKLSCPLYTKKKKEVLGKGRSFLFYYFLEGLLDNKIADNIANSKTIPQISNQIAP